MEPSHMLQSRFNKLKERYSSRYNPEVWQYIEEHFYDDLHNYEIPDVLRQVYAELDITKSGASYYRKHFKLLKKLFPIDGSIVEVGAGRIPSFANLLAQEQLRIGKGTVTIYEPLLVQLNPKYPNMTLNKTEFDENTDITNADLVVGIMPCEATESILANAIKHQKPFYVAMCGCVHSPLSSMSMLGYGTSPELYQEQVIEQAKDLIKEYASYHLEITRLTNNPINYPILYSSDENTLHR